MSPPAIISRLWPKNVPVLEAFVRQHPGIVVLALGDVITEEVQQRIAAAGGNLIALHTLVDDSLQEGLPGESTVRQAQLGQALADPSWSPRWQGPIAADVLADCVSKEAAVRLPDLIHLAAALQQAAAKYAVRLAVVNEDLTPLSRILVAWARGHKVPSLHLAHSLALCEPYTIHGRIHADVMAVYGQRGCEGYEDIGIHPDRLRITGNPAWDVYPPLRQQRGEIRAALAAQHGLSAEVPIVVFGTTWAANLSSLDDEALYGVSLRAFLVAYKELREAGIALQPVVKDRPRPASLETTPERLSRLLTELGLPADSVCYALGDATPWVLSSDVLISVDSNLSAEAMLAGVPAINLLNPSGLFLGPCFAADSGIVEVEADALAGAIRQLLVDADFRARQLDAMQRAAASHNVGVDGRATERFVSLMNELALPDLPAVRRAAHLETNEPDEATHHRPGWLGFIDSLRERWLPGRKAKDPSPRRSSPGSR